VARPAGGVEASVIGPVETLGNAGRLGRNHAPKLVQQIHQQHGDERLVFDD
jgi:hypothetical protein